MPSIKRTIIILSLGLVLIASSCKTRKVLTGRMPVGVDSSAVLKSEALALISRSRENAIEYNWLSARIKVEYSDENINQDFTAVVRMRRDSMLWISLQGPFGIEGARILVSRDSIFVVNKLGNEFLRQPLSYLSKVLPMPTDVRQLQDFILGNYLQFKGAGADYRGKADSMQQIQEESPYFRCRFLLYPQNCTLASCVLTDKMLGREMCITFGGYMLEQGKPFSGERNIDIKGAKKVSMHWVFIKTRVNEPLSFPFSIDPAMKEVDNIRF